MKLLRLLRFIGPLLAIFCFWGTFSALPVQAEQQDYSCLVYFTGISCVRCKGVASMMVEQLPREYPNLVIIEYEINKLKQNAPLFDEYTSVYNTKLEIPQVIFNQEQYLIGNQAIEHNIRDILAALETNPCPLIDGTAQEINELDLNSLPGFPHIWHQEKVLSKNATGLEGDHEILKELLLGENPSDTLKDAEFTVIEPIKTLIAGGSVEFDNAISIGDWIFQWNGEGVVIPLEPEPTPIPEPTPVPEPTPEPEPTMPTLTIPKVLSLAAVDAVNPCAFSVLLLLLVSIIACNPGNRRSILYAGLAFTASVFIMYLIYGLVFIRLFQVIQALAVVKFGLFRGLAIAAIVFGVFNIRDFVRYKPGGVGTEMPLLMRPRVKRILSKITSTKGAFIAGLLVTVFLLPCTIGPYIIAAGILSVFDMVSTAPILLLYNLVFILPFLGIVGGVYLGMRRVQDIYLWKERNISKLHLVAGCIILGLGIFMLLGLV